MGCPSRRRFLQLSSTGGIVAVAGCTGSSDDTGDTEDEDGTENGPSSSENGAEFTATDVRMDLRNAGNIQTNNPIYANYNTPHNQDTLIHDPEKTYDLHKQVFEQLEDVDETISRYVSSIREDSEETVAKEESGIVHVDGYERFSEENWLNADPQDSVRLAIRYLMALDQRYEGNHSGRTAEYTTAVTQAFEQEHPEYNIHAFPASIHAGSRGAGLVHIEDTDTLCLFEVLLSGIDDWDENEQLDYVVPKIDNSEYFRDDQASERSTHHPLRFGENERERTRGISNFEDAKTYAASMFVTMNKPSVVGENATDVNIIENAYDEGFALTTGYLSDVTENLRFYNDSNFDSADFDTIRSQSALAFELNQQHDDNFVLGGSVDSPWILRVEDDNLLDDIWADADGEYDNLIEEMEEYDEAVDIVSEDYDDMDKGLEPDYQLENLGEVEALND